MYLKIHFTIIFAVLALAWAFWLYMYYSDHKRSDL